jgi:hypothetical protein
MRDMSEVSDIAAGQIWVQWITMAFALDASETGPMPERGRRRQIG